LRDPRNKSVDSAAAAFNYTNLRCVTRHFDFTTLSLPQSPLQTMATTPTRSAAPERPIPPAPVGASSNGNNAQPLNEALKQAQNTVVSNISALNTAAGIPTINISPGTSPEELKNAAVKAKAALGLPSVTSQSTDKGAQGAFFSQFFCLLV
jgi:hypothetical protein